MKILSIIVLILLLCSCNDNSTEYAELRSEPGVEMLEVENDGYFVVLDAEPLKESQDGLWTIITGLNGEFSDSSLCSTEFYGEPGQTYVLEWTVSNPVESLSERTTVSFKSMEVETYMIFTDTIENMYLDLYGNLPRYGATAKWEILIGEDGQINNADSHEATLWGKPDTKYRVQYSHIYGDAIESTVFDITLGEFAANAGIDKTVVPSTSSDADQKIVTLWADLPYGATGVWELISGDGGEVLMSDDPHSLFRGSPETAYHLKWTVDYNGQTSIDTVQFSIMGTWGRFIDPVDDSEYKTVIIGDLEWMAENYRYTYLYDGVEEGNWWYGLGTNSEMIDLELDSVKIPGNVVDNDEERRYYGKLYPLRCAIALAPDGWRLPTGEEFVAMTNEFGGLQFCGERLRKGGISGLDLVSGGYYAPSDYFGFGQFASQDYFGAYLVDQEIDDDTDYIYYYICYAAELDENGNEIPGSNEVVSEQITKIIYAMSVRYVRDIR